MASSIQVALPKPLKAWVEQQVERKGYGTAGEYVRQMLQKERRLQAVRERVDAELIDAINSGKSTPMTRRDWQRIRAQGLKIAGRRA